MAKSKKNNRMKSHFGKQTQVAGWELEPQEVVHQIRAKGKKVLTFFGYSGMGYQDEQRVLDLARKVLDRFPAEKTLVNIGATAAGLGAVYVLAKEMGFETSGIVSTCALEYPGGFSRHVDTVYFVRDDIWGGCLVGSDQLSPTSEAMVKASDYAVGIGGNEISRDELLAARQRGLPVIFFPADMDHKKLRKKMGKGGQPGPEDFQGAAHQAFFPVASP
jgi:hypothetical protein